MHVLAVAECVLVSACKGKFRTAPWTKLDSACPVCAVKGPVASSRSTTCVLDTASVVMGVRGPVSTGRCDVAVSAEPEGRLCGAYYIGLSR